MPPPAHTPVAQPRLPPPPPTLPSELLDLVNSLSRRLLDLEQHQVPQLASCTGPLSFHEQLAGDVRSEMLGIKRDVEVRSAPATALRKPAPLTCVVGRRVGA